MAAVPVDLVPGAERLHRLLAGSMPAAVTPTLVHGDYRLGNLICRGTEPAALIDWEIWSVGDPRVELGWFLVFADGANFPGVGREVAGLPGADELVAAYAADGRRVDDLAWFDALGRYKMAAIMGHNLRRHLEGRHHDPDQERLPDTIRRLIETGLEACRGL
jgi:aminoglycoside phosphotransferase (APT) family kinase protein